MPVGEEQDRGHNHQKSARDKQTNTDTGFRKGQQRHKQDSAALFSSSRLKNSLDSQSPLNAVLTTTLIRGIAGRPSGVRFSAAARAHPCQLMIPTRACRKKAEDPVHESTQNGVAETGASRFLPLHPVLADHPRHLGLAHLLKSLFPIILPSVSGASTGPSMIM